MVSKSEIYSEQEFSGILYIIGSILFTVAAAIAANSEKQSQEDIKKEEQISSSHILLAAFWIFLTGSIIYVIAAYQRLQQSREQSKSGNQNAALPADTWAFAGSVSILISVVILLIDGQLRVEETEQNS